MKRNSITIGVSTLFFLIISIALVSATPTLTVTGFDADGISMVGDMTTGYVLDTFNIALTDHLIQFGVGTTSDETLQSTYFPFILINSTVAPSDIKAYYDIRGVPEPFLTYLKNATDGNAPFVYIDGTTIKLIDAAKHDILSADVDMTIPDDFPMGTYTVQGTIINSSGDGNSTITLILHITGDRIAPIITQPNIFLEATGPLGAVATFPVSAIDDVDGIIPVDCTPSSGTIFGIGDTTVYCNCSDNHRNTANITFNINVKDTTPPSITSQPDLIIEATNSSGATVNFTISTTDIVDGPTIVNCSQDSSIVFPFGTTNVTCVSSDSRNNTAQINFTVSVYDTIPPVTIDDLFSGWYTNFFNITLSATDNASGIAWTNYCINETDGCTPNINNTNIEIYFDGIYYLKYHSEDNAGNNESITNKTVLVDTTAPITTDNALPSWYNTAVNITLYPNDTTSGISITQYCVDQNNSCTPSGNGTNIIINTDGTNYIKYQSIDVAGNIENITNKIILLDATAPITTDDVPVGWINHTINITLNATDLTGVNWTKYCIDLTNNCTPNITKTNITVINISTQGIKYIRYHSADNLSHIETIKSTQIRIDLTAPVTTANTSGWKNNNITIVLTSNDTLSGVNFTLYCTDIVNSCVPNISIVNISDIQFNYSIEGSYYIRYRSVDNINNTETIKSTFIGIDKNVPITTDNAPTGWQNNDVNITLTAGDTRSGVAWTRYCIDRTNTCTPGTTGTTVIVNLEGTSYVRYRSSDNAGNQNNIQSRTIKIDKTAPKLNVSSPIINTYNTTSINLNFTVSEILPGTNSSGVNSCWYVLDNILTQNITGCNNTTISNLSEAPHTIVVYAKDNVSNINTSQIISIAVGLSLPAPLMANSSNITINNTNDTIIVLPYGFSMQNINVTSDVPENYFTTVNMLVSTNTTSMGRYINLSKDLTLTRNTTTRFYSVTIFAGTVISAPSNWNGILTVPTIIPTSGITPVVDAGMLPSIYGGVEFGNNYTSLTLNHAARIVITGYAGQMVGYSKDGSFTKIISNCLADTQAYGNALPDYSECKIDVGNDLVIWTKHFTSFVVYTQYAIPPTIVIKSGGSSRVVLECSEWNECVDGKQTRTCAVNNSVKYPIERNCTAKIVANTENNNPNTNNPTINLGEPASEADSQKEDLSNGITGGVVTDIEPLSIKSWMSILLIFETTIIATALILIAITKIHKRKLRKETIIEQPYNVDNQQGYRL